jgi:hypothetical protein
MVDSAANKSLAVWLKKCSQEHMSEKFDFLIRPLSVERGFELCCEGLLRDPLPFHRLIEAILAAAQIGQGLEAEIHIFNTDGEVAEVLELNRNAAAELARS